ncbi:Phage head-tail joining protein [Arachidicoccus rhizosphaerae]|uniref:Phage head-tail joining protein n=1 Tax=Arachidicoccus rhizosphaerae TaxID=551991 RepID=A0A1H4CFA8_9BACT|nr:head-tail adaptor protein [Arachidicoccus rhizosphaerae]SEA59067.1 Phage head-tail joining protein [Arachidicoccus rhizosphaerae]
MTIAELSQVIEVYRRETITNEDGETETAETLQFQTYAKVKLMSEYEKFQQGINTDTVVYKIWYRYLAERMIKKNDIIKWNGQEYLARSFSKETEIKLKRWFTNSMALQAA